MKNRDKKRIDGCIVMYNNETTAALYPIDRADSYI
jgi:hypothetical protein